MRKRKEGSIVLEAALILPVFLSFIILLISFIRIAMVQITLDNTVAEATKQIATHYYPLDLAYGEFSRTELGSNIDEGIEEVENRREKIIEFEQTIKTYSDKLPTEITSILFIRENLESELVGTYDSALAKGFEPILDYYADDTILDITNLQITKVVLPDLRKRDNLYFGIEVRYDMQLNIPFFNRPITFTNAAYERVWIGDGAANYIREQKSDEAGSVEEEPDSDSNEESMDDRWDDSYDDEEEYEDEEDEVKLVIDSINSPVQRGRYVRIFATGPPNELAYIEIRYQSGFVKSTNVHFDKNGKLKADIRIGGNSNEGKYEAIITSGNQEAKGNFEVLSKDNMDNYKNDRQGLIDSLFN